MISTRQVDERLSSKRFQEIEEEIAAWNWMVDQAAARRTERRIQLTNREITVRFDRGQLDGRRQLLADAFGWRPERVRKWLERLVENDDILVTHETGIPVVTINYFDDYRPPGSHLRLVHSV